MDAPIVTHPHACPICGGTVKGNDQYSYYCKRCNLLFQKRHLILIPSKRRSKGNYKKDLERIRELFKEEHPDVKAPQAPIKRPKVTAMEQRKRFKYLASKKSDKFHLSICPHTHRIKEDNLIFFRTDADAKAHMYKPGPCVAKPASARLKDTIAESKGYRYAQTKDSNVLHVIGCPYIRDSKDLNFLKEKKRGIKHCKCMEANPHA